MSNPASLSVGGGICRPEASLYIRPSAEAHELGASQMAISQVIAAIHDRNRHADPSDYVALGLPSLSKGHFCGQAGHEIELIGSQAALSDLLAREKIARMKRRNMLSINDIDEVMLYEGDMAAAYIRDRRLERGPGLVEREKRRAERRGVPYRAPYLKPVDRRTIFSAKVGKITLNIKEELMPWTGAAITVSTYGVSSSKTPCVIPIRIAQRKWETADA